MNSQIFYLLDLHCMDSLLVCIKCIFCCTLFTAISTLFNTIVHCSFVHCSLLYMHAMFHALFTFGDLFQYVSAQPSGLLLHITFWSDFAHFLACFCSTLCFVHISGLFAHSRLWSIFVSVCSPLVSVCAPLIIGSVLS